VDILENIKTVGEITDRRAEAAGVVAELQQRIDKVRNVTKDVDFRPTTLCLDWMEPPYAAGHWVPEMVEIAGGTDVFGIKGKASIEINWERIIEADPERIIVMPCGFDISRVLKEINVLKSVKGWGQINAVRNSRAYASDGNSFFSRPGPRAVTGLEILAEIIQPDYFIEVAPPHSYEWI
jgi:iron complex transport system substrate-binding protein